MFAELLEKIGEALDEQELPYMVIGGQAVLISWRRLMRGIVGDSNSRFGV